jgi:DNA (cytosine-5)-methyltransferase 1
MIKIGTDFSGIGSPEQALIKLGINHKSMFACDVDKYAKQSYLANYNTGTFYDDITTRDHNEAPYVDLYVAGFPCQTFSMAGKRKGFEDTRGTLFFDLLKYLKAKKPKYFILENVKGLLSHNGGRTFLTILDCLAKTVNRQYSFSTYEDGLNYHIYYKVLNTKDYGIPQNRERVFIVGFRDEKHSFKFPKKIPLELRLKDVLQDSVDNKYYLSDKMIKGIAKSNFRERQPIDINGVCKTLKIGGDTPCFEERKKIRRLTPLECFILQGFPDSFHKKCVDAGLSDTQLYKQAGNSITVDVMSYLIKEILINEITE